MENYEKNTPKQEYNFYDFFKPGKRHGGEARLGKYCGVPLVRND
jgi:hypothetical protein